MSRLDDAVSRHMDGLSDQLGTWVIYVDGRRFYTSKGKGAWSRIGDAKNALRNAFDVYLMRVPREKREEVWQDFLDRRVSFKEVVE